MEIQATVQKPHKREFKAFFLSHRIEFLLLGIYVLASVGLALAHEPWRDEAQAWLFTRDQSLPQLLSNLHIEGHPALWFLLLWPLTHLGLPYASEFVLHGALAMVCAVLLLFKSPFTLRVKALLLFSYMVGFVFNIVARNYVLLELALFSIACIFPQRFGKWRLLYGALLIMLINSHVYGALAAGALLCYDALFLFSHDASGRRHIHNRAIPAAVVLLMALSGYALFLLTMSGPRYASVTDPTLGTLLTSDILEMAKKVLGYSFGSDNTGVLEGLYQVSAHNPLLISLMRFFDVNILPILALLVLLGRFKPALLGGLFLVPFSALLVFSTNVAYRHVALFALVVLAGYWIAETTPGEFPLAAEKWDAVVQSIRVRRVPLLRAVVAVVLVCGTLAYGVMAGIEIRSEYSDGKNLASFLQTKGYDTNDTVVVTTNPEQFSSALPYLDNLRKDTVPGLSDNVSFLLWDQHYYSYEPGEHNPFEYARWLKSQGKTQVLVIFSSKAFQKPSDFRCIYDTRDLATVKNEHYAVFIQMEE